MNILVFGMTENPGGIESFLMTYYRKMNTQKFHFDFLCNSYNKVAFEDELISNGSKLFHFTSRRKNPILFIKELNEFMVQNAKTYDALWVNVCSLANIDYLKIAKKFGIKTLIIHSHNNSNMDGKFRLILHKFNKKRIKKYATDFWACSESAAKWFFEKDIRYELIRNAIDVPLMKYSNEGRIRIRREFNLGNSYVVGNIGRLHFQKNQEFILQVFSAFHRKYNNAKLLLVGQGEDLEKLKNKAKCLSIHNDIVFAGVRSDIRDCLSAMDMFLFPSKFEGLGIAGLEAQASGLPVLASRDVIPDEIAINDNFFFECLNSPINVWVKKMEYIYKHSSRYDYSLIKDNFLQKGYDIEIEVKHLEHLLELCNVRNKK